MQTLPSKENLECEFKSDTQEKNGLPDNDLIETAVGMSNSNGGTIYLGIEDDGKATGLINKHKDPIGVVTLIANCTNPSISVRAEIINENDVNVLAISVPKSRAIIATSSGKVLKRRLKYDGTPETVPLYPYEISTRLSELSLLDFSSKKIENSTISDFDILEIERLKKIIRNNPSSDRGLLELDDNDLLKALHFIVEEDGKTTPTMVGLLFIGKEESIKYLIPTHKSSFQVLQGTNVKINESLNEPLLKLFEKFLTFFKAWNPEKEMQYGLFRISISEFDELAFREGLLNAFCHRDYSQLGQVRVLINDEGLTVSSQGGFIDGVNYKNLISVEPHGRNPCLADTLKRLGLVEKTSRGIDKIYEGSIRYGKSWPDYSESTSNIVKLFIPRSNPDMEFTKMIIEEQNKIGRTLSINALMILSLIKNEHRTTINRLTEVINIQKTRIIPTIETLVESGLIEAISNGSTRSYILSSNVYKQNNRTIEYVRQTGIDSIRYIELVVKLTKQQNGIIAKSDIVNLLKITNNQASTLIKKLLSDRILEINQRGKYANYKLIK